MSTVELERCYIQYIIDSLVTVCTLTEEVLSVVDKFSYSLDLTQIRSMFTTNSVSAQFAKMGGI